MATGKSSLSLGFNLGDLVPQTQSVTGNTTTSGTKTIKKNLSQEGIDKIIYDVLSSDQGLASLASGENLVGGSNSSTKALLAQDLIAKITGEIANITAETVETADTRTDTESKTKKRPGPTVICTELHRQGKISTEVYYLSQEHSTLLDESIYLGYISWAPKVVVRMQRSERLSKFLAKVVNARYDMILHGRINFLGGLTIYIGHPLCRLINRFRAPLLRCDGEVNAKH